MNRISKIACFVIFSALLSSGFPNFMMQEAHAAADITYTAATATTTTITLTFSETVNGATGTQSSWTISTGQSVSSVTHTNGQNTATLNLGSALGTGDKPNVTYAGTSIVASDLGGDTVVNGAVTASDGIDPVLSSAQVTSSNTIVLKFSEDGLTDVEIADFTVTKPTRSITAVSVSGSSVTLTVTGQFTYSDTPTIAISGGDGVQDDDSNTQTSGSVVATTTLSAPRGSGCDGDCEEPTLGVLPNGQRIVDDGFTYNGHSIDVERFFTPYPLITAQTGKQNTAQFKIYENNGPDNIAHFDFAFGLGKDQIISDSKAMIEVDFVRDGTHTVNIVDPENALDNVSVTTDIVACNGGPTQCLEITINHMFREPLDFDIVGTNVWDYSRQSWQNYYNHGIEVVGPSLNPVKQHDGINQGHIYHLTETSKTTAMDEFGDSWTFQYGKWMKDFIKQERIQDGDVQVFDRMHSDYASYKENLSKEAFNQLVEMCPICVEQYADFDDSTKWEYGNKISKLSNPEIQRTMELESQRAQEILKYIMDPKLSSTEKYKALVELEKDDRPISEILKEERIMKQILQAERHWLKQVIAPNQ